MSKRSHVFELLEKECHAQEKKSMKYNDIGIDLVKMEAYLAGARKRYAREFRNGKVSKELSEETLDTIIKVAAIAIRCLENHDLKEPAPSNENEEKETEAVQVPIERSTSRWPVSSLLLRPSSELPTVETSSIASSLYSSHHC